MRQVLYVVLFLLVWGFVETVMAQEKPLKVFVLAGQSNMVGRRAKVAELPEDLKKEQAGALFFTGRGWVPLAPGVTERQGFGPEISFARRMSERLGEPIGIIKHSRGGSNLAEDWSPENPKSLYAALLKKVKAARKTREIEIVGMVWLQGGRDAKFEAMARAYAANLKKFIERARKDFASADMPFVAGRSSLPKKTFPFADAVRKAQEQCRSPHYAFIDCDTIEKRADRTHYTTAGYVEVGYRLADAMLRMMK